MAPGIVDFAGNFYEGDVVVVIDERHRKPIAITTALCNLENARKLKHGKVLKNIHYVGDKFWKMVKRLSQTS